MFDPDAESVVLEIVRGFFDIPAADMMKIGDQTKNLFFDPGIESKEAAIEQIKSALTDMPNEHVLIAGVFLSGLLRCSLVQQAEQQYMPQTGESCKEPEDRP